jgi:hypothetical protein
VEFDLYEKQDHDESELLTVRKHYAHKAIEIHNEYIVVAQYIRSDQAHHDTEYEMDKRSSQTHDPVLVRVVYELLPAQDLPYGMYDQFNTLHGVFPVPSPV